MFDSPGKLALGLLTGLVFGFVLQKSRASKHSVIVGQLLLRDWTVAKIMGTAIAVGSVGVYALVAAGMTTPAIKPVQLGGILTGAALFGVGLALLGYCPGTTVAAAGEGRRDALAGIAGMLVGAAAFVVGWRHLEPVQKGIVDAGAVTWAAITGTPTWPWVLGLALAGGLAYVASRVLGWPRGPRGMAPPLGSRP